MGFFTKVFTAYPYICFLYELTSQTLIKKYINNNNYQLRYHLDLK